MPEKNIQVKKKFQGVSEYNDFSLLAVLLVICLAVGIYQIATTVLISKDGVFYITEAQKFSDAPVEVIQKYPFGYTFLVFSAYKIISGLWGESSLYIWIYSAQGVSFLGRLLALAALYYLGKYLVGKPKAFWSVFILIILPYPSKMGIDALREWPYLLFLVIGFLFLFHGISKKQWWTFGWVGLSAGLGHMIRPECAQLIIYAMFWLGLSLFKSPRRMKRAAILGAAFILLAGFALPVIPYMKAKGSVLPEKLQKLKHQDDKEVVSLEKDYHYLHETDNISKANIYFMKVVRAFIKLTTKLSENLMYYFMPSWLVGFYIRFRKRAPQNNDERFLLTLFLLFNISVLLLLYMNYGYISRRHTLPMVVLTIFNLPAGMRLLTDWLRKILFSSRPQMENILFAVLLVTGIAICTPKLFRPLGADKEGYRETARWLSENSDKNDVIAVPDKRVSFYAQRPGKRIKNGTIPSSAKFLVTIEKNEEATPPFGQPLRKEYRQWVNKKKKRIITVYRVQ